MSEVVVIAHVRAKPEAAGQVEQELLKMIEPTRNETGCLQYDLLKESKDPGHFVFYERWSSQEAHQTHLDSDHVAAFVLACKGGLTEATVHHMKTVS